VFCSKRLTFLTYSVTLLTKLNEASLITLDIRENSNTSGDFLQFLQFCIAFDVLIAGNFLIIDNATVHVCNNNIDKIYNLVNYFGIQIRLLPTYSPELNPCELCFNLTKGIIRETGVKVLYDQIVEAFSTITKNMLVNSYKHCLSLENKTSIFR
jgi:hypothetical protein